MNCPTCGTANADGAAFCANCGSGLTSGNVATAETGGGLPHPMMEPGGDDLLEKVKLHLGTDYSIEKELGRGGMAVVYKGVERALERVVAIKVVPPESANAGQAAERFRREARLAASLDHANIIPVYRVGTAGPLHYMAMKFVEGRAVDSIIDSQGALPLSVAIAILRYSAAGLAFAHEKKIVHRDIKGANILVDKDGRVMVSDFGIARALEEVSLTASGMVIGTPYYMSPEQCGGQKISPQSDQYSLGIMGFQMLTGEVPFNAESMVGVIQHHYMTPVPDIRAVRQDVPQELLDIIYCSLNKAPEDRFTTTREMAQALENIPQTDTDREEAEKLLRELSAGKVIPKVRTGTLPPLTLTISGPAAPVVPRPVSAPRKASPAPGLSRSGRKKKKKKNKLMLPMVATVVLMVGAGGYMWQQQQAEDAAKKAKDAELANGRVVIAGLPLDTMQVVVNNRLAKNGDTVTAPSGAIQINANFADYTARTITVVIPDSLKVITADLSLVPIAQASANPGPTLASAPQAPTSGNRNAAASQSSAAKDSNEVRFKVSPNYAEIFVDDRRIGASFKQLFLTLGSHRVRFAAPGCGTPVEQTIDVQKGPTLIVPPVIIQGC